MMNARMLECSNAGVCAAFSLVSIQTAAIQNIIIIVCISVSFCALEFIFHVVCRHFRFVPLMFILLLLILLLTDRFFHSVFLFWCMPRFVLLSMS